MRVWVGTIACAALVVCANGSVGSEDTGPPEAAATEATKPAAESLERQKTEWEAIPPMKPINPRIHQRPVRREGPSGGSVFFLQKIFFPPNPPPMGVEIMARGNKPEVSNAPEPLKLFVAEPFYAPLSTRLILQDLSEDHRKRINALHGIRQGLLAEIRDTIYGLQTGDPAAREAELRALARTQSSRLIATEKEAESLRYELFNPKFVGSNGDWNAHREWRLGKGKLDKPREEIALFEYQVMRAAVFYLEGLSPEQRRLLREVVMDLEDAVFRGDSKPVAEFGFRFFAPHTARIRLPDAAPPGLVDRVVQFEEEKNQLKSELRELIFSLDSYMLYSSKRKACEALAEKQKQVFEDLDAIAEDIRRDMIQVAGWERRKMPEPLPEDLDAMINSFFAEKQRLQEGYNKRIRQVQREMLPRPERNASTEEKEAWKDRFVDAIEKANAEYQAKVAPELKELGHQLSIIAIAIERATGEVMDIDYSRSSDVFLTEFVAERRSLEGGFDYETAVLEPGLAPAQRRLLFAAAIERLALPLPGAEFQAASMPGTLLK